MYILGIWRLGESILCARLPSSVIRSAPSESLSSLPAGKGFVPQLLRYQFKNGSAVFLVGGADIALRLIQKNIGIFSEADKSSSNGYSLSFGVNFYISSFGGSSVDFYFSFFRHSFNLASGELRVFGDKFIQSDLFHAAPFWA